MSSFLDETGAETQPAKCFVTLMSVLHPMLFHWGPFSYSFAQGHLSLLYQLQACWRKVIFPVSPTVPLHSWFPISWQGTGNRAQYYASVCQAFRFIDRILHHSSLKRGSVLQAGVDSRSACLKLSSDSSVCNWYDVVWCIFFKLQTALCAEALRGWFLFWLLSCWLAKHKVCVTFWG